MKNKPVGIVATNTYQIDYSMPWHPSMQRVAEDLTAIEKSVMECALAGCSSIWICCDETMQPLVKERLGDYVRDPVILEKSNFTRFPEDNRVNIPIYFYLTHPKDRDKRPGPLWDIINAALAIYHFSFKFSRWLSPDKYYISFCYGLYDFSKIRKFRKSFTDSVSQVLEFNGKTMFDGLLLGGCLTGDDIKKIIVYLKSKKFDKNTILTFEDLQLTGQEIKIPIDEYYSCISWQNYIEYIQNKNFEFSYNREIFFNIKSSGVDC